MLARSNVWGWLAVVWVGVIFFSSSSLAGKSSEEAFSALSRLLLAQLQPGTPPYNIIHLLADKSVHICLFAVFAVLLWKALAHTRRRIGWILLLGAITGTCSEILQSFFPGRDPAFTDVLINIGGTSLGITGSVILSKLHASGRLPRVSLSRQGPPIEVSKRA
jgi:VanZ family protein